MKRFPLWVIALALFAYPWGGFVRGVAIDFASNLYPSMRLKTNDSTWVGFPTDKAFVSSWEEAGQFCMEQTALGFIPALRRPSDIADMESLFSQVSGKIGLSPDILVGVWVGIEGFFEYRPGLSLRAYFESWYGDEMRSNWGSRPLEADEWLQQYLQDTVVPNTYPDVCGPSAVNGSTCEVSWIYSTAFHDDHIVVPAYVGLRAGDSSWELHFDTGASNHSVAIPICWWSDVSPRESRSSLLQLLSLIFLSILLLASVGFSVTLFVISLHCCCTHEKWGQDKKELCCSTEAWCSLDMWMAFIDLGLRVLQLVVVSIVFMVYSGSRWTKLAEGGFVILVFEAVIVVVGFVISLAETAFEFCTEDDNIVEGWTVFTVLDVVGDFEDLVVLALTVFLTEKIGQVLLGVTLLVTLLVSLDNSLLRVFFVWMDATMPDNTRGLIKCKWGCIAVRFCSIAMGPFSPCFCVLFILSIVLFIFGEYRRGFVGETELDGCWSVLGDGVGIILGVVVLPVLIIIATGWSLALTVFECDELSTIQKGVVKLVAKGIAGFSLVVFTILVVVRGGLLVFGPQVDGTNKTLSALSFVIPLLLMIVVCALLAIPAVVYQIFKKSSN